MTPDIQRLRDSLDDIQDIVSHLELELVDDPAWAEPSDTSYLSPKERVDPDIASNVEAMADTNKLISWFGRDQEGFVGLWRGPTNRPLASAPILRLDTEGQYAIVAATIGDYLAISMGEDDLEDARETLTGAGFAVRGSAKEIWGARRGFEDPNEYRNELYNVNRERRGLPRV